MAWERWFTWSAEAGHHRPARVRPEWPGAAKFLTGLDGFSRWRFIRIGCKPFCVGLE